MIKGDITLNSSITSWEWYSDSNVFHLFICLLTNAASEDCTHKGVELKRGQICTTLAFTAAMTGLSIQTVRHCLFKLESTNEIVISTTNKYSVITICNYDKYQLSNSSGFDKYIVIDGITVKKIRTKTFIYVILDLNTYLSKIGRSVNPQYREKTLLSQSPSIKMMFVSKRTMAYYETFLHKLFKAQRIRGEWFSLSAEDITYIKNYNFIEV